MSVPDADQVGRNREGGHALDELVLDCDEGGGSQAQVLQAVTEQVLSHQPCVSRKRIRDCV